MSRKIFFGKIAISLLIISLFVGCAEDLLPGTAKSDSELEPNDDFSSAQKITDNDTSSITISGTLSNSFDTDIFNIGELTSGTKLNIEINSQDLSSYQALTIALFDKDYDIAYLEDVDVTPYYQSAFTHTIRKQGTYFIGISAQDNYLPENFGYDIRISKSSVFTPSPSSQIVYLDFNGASNISLGDDFYSYLRPFSKATNKYDDEQLADMIVNLVKQDYKGLNIQFISSYDSPAPILPHTTVYITGDYDEYLGLSEHVDWYNADSSDYAVVFAGTFDTAGFTMQEYAQSIANVISHELGHLLGLIHTDDDTELMDEATPASKLVENQDFHRAPIVDFPIGWQDSLELLEIILGTN